MNHQAQMRETIRQDYAADVQSKFAQCEAPSAPELELIENQLVICLKLADELHFPLERALGERPASNGSAGPIQTGALARIRLGLRQLEDRLHSANNRLHEIA